MTSSGDWPAASSEAREGAATPAPDAPSAAAAYHGHGAAVIRRRVDLAAGQCFT